MFIKIAKHFLIRVPVGYDETMSFCDQSTKLNLQFNFYSTYNLYALLDTHENVSVFQISMEEKWDKHNHKEIAY